jgi:hypothetical protein
MMLKRIDDEKKVLERNLETCQEENVQLDERLSRDRPEVEMREETIEDAVDSLKPLYRQ